MVQLKCIEKFRNNQGKIYAYKLVDINGTIREVYADKLKDAIRDKVVDVVNLTLSTDNRLVDSNNKSLDIKQLENSPIIKETTKKDKVKLVDADVSGSAGNTRFDKNKRPYEATTYTEFWHRLLNLLNVTLRLGELDSKFNMNTFTKDSSGNIVGFTSVCDCIDNGRARITLQGNELKFSIFYSDRISYSEVYNVDYINMKADFIHILKIAQQFVFKLVAIRSDQNAY